MTKGFATWLTITLIFSHVFLSAVLAPGQLLAASTVPPKCQKESDTAAGFTPQAVTLVSLNVRAEIPEYSILKGQWVLGQVVDVLPPNTCLVLLEKKTVGVIQIWYLVQYRKGTKAALQTGWVWAGTKDVDETRYLGGDLTPQLKPGDQRGGVSPFLESNTWALVAGLAYAQADVPVSGPGLPALSELPRPPMIPTEKSAEYYVEVPLLGWVVGVGTISTIILFLAMVLGMLAKAVWDQTEGEQIRFQLVKILRPLLISPIAFSAFWGPMYIQQGGAGVSLTMALYAFQIGFMWQHVLEKKLVPGTEPGTEDKPKKS